MDWIIGIMLLLAGALIGFFAAKFWLQQSGAQQNKSNVEDTLRQLVAQHSNAHIQQSRELVASIEQQAAALAQQLNHFEDVMAESQREPGQQQLEYFSEQETAYLRNKQRQSGKDTNKPDYQPRDYAMAGSGLFTGAKKQQSDAEQP